MQLATEKDFDKVMSIFKIYPDIFPHITEDYIRLCLKQKDYKLLLMNDVVITFRIYKTKYSQGNIQLQPGDCILHQIAAKNQGDGSATKVERYFLNNINTRVFLSVPKNLTRTKNFHIKNGFKVVGWKTWIRWDSLAEISLRMSKIEMGDVFLYEI
tara:strand:- start:5437 stop:5904 length:468 start_codon:yes stop_codon:yes gene_type:complete